MEKIKFSVGLRNMVVVKGDGRGGGGCGVMAERVNVILRNYSTNHIDVDVVRDDGFSLRFTGVYGEPKMELKHRTWKMLRDLHGLRSMPWLCAGDFNEILHHHEKEGGVPRSQTCLDRFKEALEDCELLDLGFTSDIFMW